MHNSYKYWHLNKSHSLLDTSSTRCSDQRSTQHHRSPPESKLSHKLHYCWDTFHLDRHILEFPFCTEGFVGMLHSDPYSWTLLLCIEVNRCWFEGFGCSFFCIGIFHRRWLRLSGSCSKCLISRWVDHFCMRRNIWLPIWIFQSGISILKFWDCTLGWLGKMHRNHWSKTRFQDLSKPHTPLTGLERSSTCKDIDHQHFVR